VLHELLHVDVAKPRALGVLPSLSTYLVEQLAQLGGSCGDYFISTIVRARTFLPTCIRRK
jgi:hypothetical protein